MVRIERSFPAPVSLEIEKQKKSGRYDLEDVVTRLAEDFGNKCYLCEIRPVQDPEVEHLLPHKGGKYRERMFDWENLFWSCRRCNSIKNKSVYDEGIFDCCRSDPEIYISSKYEDGQVFFEKTACGDNAIIDRTLMLLDEIYNQTNSGIRKITSDVRVKALAEEMNVFYATLGSYDKNHDTKGDFKALRAMLDRKSRFAAFKRSYIRNHREQYPLLYEFAIE